MPDIYCLLIGIGIRLNKWNPTIFGVELECHLQGSRKTDVWLIIMHVKIFRVVLLVAIW